MVAACGVPEDERAELGTHVRAGLHGLVSLRINKPSFPWPGIEELVDGDLRPMLPAGDEGVRLDVSRRGPRPAVR